jgi:hypothetical protein
MSESLTKKDYKLPVLSNQAAILFRKIVFGEIVLALPGYWGFSIEKSQYA